MILRVLSEIEAELVDFIYEWEPGDSNIKEIPTEELYIKSSEMDELLLPILDSFKPVKAGEFDSGTLSLEVDLNFLEQRYTNLKGVWEMERYNENQEYINLQGVI